MPDRSMTLAGTVGRPPNTLGAVTDALAAVPAGGELTMVFRSRGGGVITGFAIVDLLRCNRISGGPTVIADIHRADSIASVIVQACDRRVIRWSGSMTLHNPGDGSDVAQSERIAAAYAARTGRSVAYWRSVMDAKQKFSAVEAVMANLADEVGAP